MSSSLEGIYKGAKSHVYGPGELVLKTDLPVVPSWVTGYFTEGFSLHPLVLGGFADTTRLALHSGTTANRLDVFIQAIERPMRTSGWGDRGGFLRALRRAQSSGDVKRALGRTQLARLKRQLVQRSSGQTGRSGRVI